MFSRGYTKAHYTQTRTIYTHAHDREKRMKKKKNIQRHQHKPTIACCRSTLHAFHVIYSHFFFTFSFSLSFSLFLLLSVCFVSFSFFFFDKYENVVWLSNKRYNAWTVSNMRGKKTKNCDTFVSSIFSFHLIWLCLNPWAKYPR